MESEEEMVARVNATVERKKLERAAVEKEKAERLGRQSMIATGEDGEDGDALLHAVTWLLDGGVQPDGRRSVYPSAEFGRPVTVLVYPRPHEGKNPLVYALTGEVRLTLYAKNSLELRGENGQLALKGVEGGVKVDRRYMNPGSQGRPSTASPLSPHRRTSPVRGNRR